MASKGKRGAGYKVRTRTIVKYRNRAMKIARRTKRGATSLAKERGMTTLAGLAIGYVDGKRATGGFQFLNKLPTLMGAGWEATAGAILHFYHSKNRGAKWADQGATALLAIGGYKMGRGQAGATVAGGGIGGNGDVLSGWMPGAG